MHKSKKHTQQISAEVSRSRSYGVFLSNIRSIGPTQKPKQTFAGRYVGLAVN